MGEAYLQGGRDSNKTIRQAHCRGQQSRVGRAGMLVNAGNTSVQRSQGKEVRDGPPQRLRGESSSQGASTEVPPFLAKRRDAWGHGRMIETLPQEQKKLSKIKGWGRVLGTLKGLLLPLCVKMRNQKNIWRRK